MVEHISSEQMRALEAAAIESGEVTGLELMERAGQGVVESILDTWPDLVVPGRAVVLCGPGNNGGDGFVVARHLLERGWTVAVFFYGDADRLPPDARTNHDKWRAMRESALYQLSFPEVTSEQALRVAQSVEGPPAATLVIDALFGIGLTRPLEGLRPVLALLQGAGVRRVSIDVPSGLAEQGPLGDGPDCVFHADLTVTFHRMKLAHGQGATCCGQIVVQDIGL